MMHGREKSDPSGEADEQSGPIRRGAGGAKGRGQGECESAKHGPGTEPGNRVTGAGVHTESCNSSFAVTHPRWEPCAGIPHARICAGGGWQQPSLPRSFASPVEAFPSKTVYK
jgi:hypothetical protein